MSNILILRLEVPITVGLRVVRIRKFIPHWILQVHVTISCKQIRNVKIRTMLDYNIYIYRTVFILYKSIKENLPHVGYFFSTFCKNFALKIGQMAPAIDGSDITTTGITILKPREII